MSFKTIFVDDDHIILFLHEKMCKTSKFDLNPVGLDSGRKLLDYLEKDSANDTSFVVFLDINMPELNAWDVLDKLKDNSILANIFVILVTSSVDDADKIKAKDYTSIIDFIEKPISIKKFESLKQHKALQDLF